MIHLALSSDLPRAQVGQEPLTPVPKHATFIKSVHYFDNVSCSECCANVCSCFSMLGETLFSYNIARGPKASPGCI